ncbi:hypothetical protein QWZ13_18510 [Reinekea marina]|uniref:Uncharacterized protein n=1 Tax=Reinekea marina TaxID=1310421 RepID=A0ABV7WRS7_9GAMM|nr:hypothetical protein [Reinekea marina]MDN3650905.1 hypothetical protein [Reinekea marina]
MFKFALGLSTAPIFIAQLVTPTRFFLELAGIPDVYVFLIGLLWLTLICSVYWAKKLVDYESPHLALLCCLLIFSPISRVPVFILWWITNKWEIGTHYDIFDTWTQALIGQLFYGSLIQVVPGFIVGSITIAVLRLTAE